MKIYFDMDGVLADFNKGVKTLCGIPAPDQGPDNKAENDAMWKAIRAVDHFYDKLDPIAGMPELFMELFGKYGQDCQILTAVPKPKRNIPMAGDDKRSWVKRVLDPQVKVNIVVREEKKDFCNGADSILIDDLASNISEWEEFDGTGIKFISAADTRAGLVKLGLLEN